MKTLTLWQPWASLIALGMKRIETRPWTTKYRGPLAIHAGKRPAVDGEAPGRVALDGLGEPVYWLPEPWTEEDQVANGQPADGDLLGFPLPLGAIVGTCQLIEVVPTDMTLEHHLHWCSPQPHTSPWFFHEWRGWWVACDTQEKWGNFAPGRFAWLLADLQPVWQRCPACWGSGHVVLESPGTPLQRTSSERCGVCDGNRRCGPVPARGHQQLWDWHA